MKIKQFFQRNQTPNNDNKNTKTCLAEEESELCVLDSPEKKLKWLRSEIIGGDVEFDSPFGKRKLSYVDHTATGRALRYIENYVVNHVLPFYGNTHTSDSYVGQRTTKTAQEAAQYIKTCLGGKQDDAILFCGSGTTAAIKRLQEVIGITVPSILRDRIIQTLSKEERWIVFVGPYEHHSNLLSWRQSLAEVVEIGLNEDGLIDMEELLIKLELYKDSNRPLLGSFSACSNVTGICSDTREIARVFHRYGGFACFDFAASGPHIEIEMRSGEADGYDAVFLSPHKFLGGPGTPGVLLMSKSLYLLNSSPPSTCGGGTVHYVNGFNDKDTLYVDDIEERENAGTPQIVQMIRAALAFWVKEYIGYEVIKSQEEKFIQKALQRLTTNPNIQVLGNTSIERQAILSFLIFSTFEGRNLMKGERDKPLHGAFVATLLNDLFGIQARGGCACAAPYGHCLLGFDEIRSHTIRSVIQKGFVGLKPGWTRVSFTYYMTDEEVEFIIDALEFIAAYGQRFLPLYHFNVKNGQWSYKYTLMDLMGKEQNGNLMVSALKEIYRNKDQKNSYHEQGFSVGNYKKYLETARHIASLLPKFPSYGSLPEEIDPEIVHFRV